jgi:DNA (cytosine-5)-methyltransferase 1
MNHIELFAGCGGLSLGLESAGFQLLMANELSPMASETFAYNFFEEDLSDLAASPPKSKLWTKWLSSQFELANLAQRLREDPRDYPELGEGISDIQGAEDLEGSLVVGSIVQLNSWLNQNPEARDALQSGFDGNGVDLVSGGPPCQSFSMAGMREYSNVRNVLPMEFANFVEHVQPRMALLENVSGILRPFNVEGKQVHAWYEVAKAFVAVGYVPLCIHTNAKFAGVAQSRPRFLMLLFRHDVYESLLPTLNDSEQRLLLPSGRFFELATDNPSLGFGDLECFDVANGADMELFATSFLSPLVEFRADQFSVRDAIDDIKLGGGNASEYKRRLDAYLAPFVADHSMENHEQRRNGPLVTRRFRIYQVLELVSRAAKKETQRILSGESNTLSPESLKELCKYKYLDVSGKLVKFKESQGHELISYFASHQTKKRTQKALAADMPAPAALSIPDDACHYQDLRTLSVREMARIQSFPDNFAFRSKVTTGGQMRKFEVPQYTQVGNAVPPLLGRALGLVVGNLLDRVGATTREVEEVAQAA